MTLRVGDAVHVRATVREVRDGRALVAVMARELVDDGRVCGEVTSLVSIPVSEIVVPA